MESPEYSCVTKSLNEDCFYNLMRDHGFYNMCSPFLIVNLPSDITSASTKAMSFIVNFLIMRRYLFCITTFVLFVKSPLSSGLHDALCLEWLDDNITPFLMILVLVVPHPFDPFFASRNFAYHLQDHSTEITA